MSRNAWDPSAHPDDIIDRLRVERDALAARVEEAERANAILEGAVRSTQDTLLHKVKRTEAVKLQLEVNRAALRAVSSASGPVGEQT